MFLSEGRRDVGPFWFLRWEQVPTQVGGWTVLFSVEHQGLVYLEGESLGLSGLGRVWGRACGRGEQTQGRPRDGRGGGRVSVRLPCCLLPPADV